MKSIHKYLFGTLLIILSLLSTSIVIRHDVPESRYFEIGEEFNQIVDMYAPGHGTGTLVDPRWILTAAHVNDILTIGRPITIGASTYTIEKIINHPAYSTSGGLVQNDIGLVKLNRMVTEMSPIPLYACTNENKKVVIFVGRGAEGNGLTGVVSFQSRDQKLRGATNLIESVSEQWLIFKFNHPSSVNATQYEGISGAGDSGGPAFLYTENGLMIAGISSFQDSNGRKPGSYNVEEYYSRVSSYVTWIESTMTNN